MRIPFKTSYMQDIRLFRDGWVLFLYAALVALVLVLPLGIDRFYLGEVTNVLVWALAGLGLMLLTGHTGQASLGHAAFLALGCYLYANMSAAGLPFLLAFPLAGILTGLVGMVVMLPALRLRGIYLAIATMAISILTDDIIMLAEPWTGGVIGRFADPVQLFGQSIDRWATPVAFYYLVLAVVVLVTLGYANLLRAPLGRSFVAIRDSEVSAQAMGVDIARTKTMAFGLSTGITGLAGALMGLFAGTYNNETFSITISIQLMMMIVIGGLGSIHGAFFGAVIVAFLPQLLSLGTEWVSSLTGGDAMAVPGLESGIFGAILVAFILFEPDGIYGRWVKIRTWLELFPFARKDMFRRQKSYLKTERLQ